MDAFGGINTYCDVKAKPVATQQCSTGILCSSTTEEHIEVSLSILQNKIKKKKHVECKHTHTHNHTLLH